MSEQVLEAMLKVREEADCLVKAETVEAALDRMAQEIEERLAGSNPLVYVVLQGGLMLAGRLLPRLSFPLELAYLHVSRYGHATHGQSRLAWRAPPSVEPQGRTVLLLDDILDEGHTLLKLTDRLMKTGAKEVLSAVLVDKQHSRKAQPGMRADFTGLDVEDRFLFGCGMDYKGYWRNLPGIYAVKGL